MSSAYLRLDRLKSISLALFFLTFLLLIYTPTSQAQTNCAQSDVPQAECEALVALYNSTGGPQWKTRTNWTQTDTVCSWYGITCENGHVTGINLSINNLVGTLPLKIGNLTALQELNLWDNQLTGAIPSQIGNLAALESLSLSDNKLTGAIPPEIGNLAALESLSLSDNQLIGAIPPEIYNLTTLRHLDLSINKFTGVIPPEIDNLSALEHLNLASNPLTGVIPPEIGNLSALKFLALVDNKMTGTIPVEIASLSQLEQLHLGFNDFTGSIPIEITTLPNLGILHLDYTLITGPIPPELGNLTNLISLSLIGNQLTGSIPPELGNLTSVVWFMMEYNQLSGPIPPELGNLTATDITLDHNQLSGPIPPELGNLTRIEYLSLGNNRLSGPIPSELGNLTTLRRLNLQRNRLSGAVPESFMQLDFYPNSNDLTLSHNALNVRGLSPQLNAFLNTRAERTWRTTQIAPPANIQVSATTAWSVTLKWTPVGDLIKPGYYEIGYSTTSGGPYTFDPGNRTVDRKADSFRVRGLTPDTRYYFVVRALRSGAVTFASANTAEVSAIPTAAPKAPPTAAALVSPVHQSIMVDSLPVLTWTPNASTEQVQAYTVKIFNKSNALLRSFPVQAIACSDVCTLDTASLNMTFKAERYKWQVVAQNTKGSSASEIRSFVIQIPGRAIPTAPIDTTAAPLPTFQWTLVGIPTHYTLEIYKDGLALVYRSTRKPVAEFGCTAAGETCTYQETTALPNGAYTWQVTATSSQYPDYQTMSAVKHFRVQFPQAPAAISPINDARLTTNTPELQWGESPNASEYRIQIRHMGTKAVVFDSDWTTVSCTGQFCTLTPSGVLAKGRYQWRVQARDMAFASNIAGSGWQDFRVTVTP